MYSNSQRHSSHSDRVKHGSHGDRQFVVSLQKFHPERSEKDLDVIFSHLHGMEALSSLREPALRALCRTVRYEYHDANDILYCQGELSTCWYILLSGSVFIEGSMFLPRSSFGKRTPGCTRRNSECLILEPSEMIVIDYPDVQVMKSGQRQQCNNNIDRVIDYDHHEGTRPIRRMNSDSVVEQLSADYGLRDPYLRNEQYMKRCSRASDTSSAYSGSDMMQSSIDDQENVDMDISGLPESMVDSDDEEGYAESTGSQRDTVQECLQKHPQDRTDDDIEILLDFIQHFRAFANMTLPTRRALCAVMMLAVIEHKGTIVMKDKEELDSWSVILNGQVEILKEDGTADFLYMGDSFGITTPTLEKMYHEGVMRTIVDDCQFLSIAQQDYHEIMNQGKENTKRHVEDGEVVMVTEHRVFDGGNRRGQIIIRASPDHLMDHLVQEHSAVDPTFVEDFLLCYRIFLKSPMELAYRLQTWFNTSTLRNKVTRVVLLWVNNHFIDFETDSTMSEFLEHFEGMLEAQGMTGQLRLLNIACGAKARNRSVTLTRATREEVLHFSVLGGLERGCGIFISKVEKGSKAYEAGLKRGDQILEVNGQNFQNITHNRALELLRGTTHLSVSIKSNLPEFKEMIEVTEQNKQNRQTTQSVSSYSKRLSAPDLDNLSPLFKSKDRKMDKKDKSWFSTVGKKAFIKKMGSFFPRNSSTSNIEFENMNKSDESLYSGVNHGMSKTSSSSLTVQIHNHLSASNPDLSLLMVEDPKQEFPDHVVKVFRADQSFKYLPIHKETTAREVVMLSLQEFNITDPSSNFSLCEVTVENESLIKQKRLPDQMTNLPDRQNLNGRYYLKNNLNTETLVPDELRSELIREAHISLLQLNTTEVASQLTLEDFKVFKDIEPTEYIDDLFKINEKYGRPSLLKFSELVNKEMFWVVSEVCSEQNLVKRMKLIKHFIKIARHCKDCKNFNTMFAIISGLNHNCVDRLRNTWEKVPNKYAKTYNDLRELMNPSRNMAKYRNLVNSENVQPPMLPFFPIAKKDLTFIHLGNDSYVDGLVNFEKFRLIARETRHICNMASAKYDVSTMFLGTPSMYESNWISGIATMKRMKARRGSTLPNAKKMYEENEMKRRVKSYLCNLKVIDNEEKLMEMSHLCEPPVKKDNALSSSISTPNLTEEKKVIVPSGPRFGAESPEAIRKLMGLSDKVRPHTSKHPHPPTNLTSPMSNRRQQHSPRHTRPVHLTPESSSVISLSHINSRKPIRTGSMGSTESASPTGSSHSGPPTYESDSGRYSYDSHSTHSAGSGGNVSPPLHRRLHPPQTVTSQSQHQSPPAAQPQVRPPLPPYHVVMQNSPAYSNYIHQTYTTVRRPPLPDYHSATQMAQLARKKQMYKTERARSHDTGMGYYNGSTKYHRTQEDDDEEQVSAV